MVQISQSYMTTGKTIALTIWTLVGKVMSLLFNMLSRFVIAKEQVSFNLMAAATVCKILEPKKIKSDSVSTFSPSIYYEVIGLDAMILVF